MSAKEELKNLIAALTPEEIHRILLRLPQLNAELVANGFSEITIETTNLF